ncbi:hypothetical protein WDW89_11160 [Deltaproteobacteria bacterium TL4]
MAKGIQIIEQEARFLIQGYIDANLDLTPLLQCSRNHLVLDTQEVREINSIGVKKWVEGMRTLMRQGKQIEYQQCSRVFVRQCNFVEEFHEGIFVSSFYAVFECEDCDELKTQLLHTHELNITNLAPKVPCPKCGQIMHTEEDSIFDFLKC